MRHGLGQRGTDGIFSEVEREGAVVPLQGLRGLGVFRRGNAATRKPVGEFLERKSRSELGVWAQRSTPVLPVAAPLVDAPSGPTEGQGLWVLGRPPRLVGEEEAGVGRRVQQVTGREVSRTSLIHTSRTDSGSRVTVRMLVPLRVTHVYCVSHAPELRNLNFRIVRLFYTIK